MPGFVMDKTGSVVGKVFSDLSGFVQGYVEAMFFTETSSVYKSNWNNLDLGDHDGSIPYDATFQDVSSDALMDIIADCARFCANAKHELSRAYLNAYDERQAGRDFWYTRNGHGVGYWDREMLEDGLGNDLSEIALTFGTHDITFDGGHIF